MDSVNAPLAVPTIGLDPCRDERVARPFMRWPPPGHSTRIPAPKAGYPEPRHRSDCERRHPRVALPVGAPRSTSRLRRADLGIPRDAAAFLPRHPPAPRPPLRVRPYRPSDGPVLPPGARLADRQGIRVRPQQQPGEGGGEEVMALEGAPNGGLLRCDVELRADGSRQVAAGAPQAARGAGDGRAWAAVRDGRLVVR